MLTRTQKEEQVAELREKLGRASSVFVADYRGITVKAAEELRGSLRGDPDNEYEYRVIKNALLRIAAGEAELEGLTEYFSGPSAVAISYGDPVGLAKLLVDFSKANECFEIKGGLGDGKTVDDREIAVLATLPNLEQLRGQLVGLIQASSTKLVRLLKEPGGQVARLVAARRTSLEEAGGD